MGKLQSTTTALNQQEIYRLCQLHRTDGDYDKNLSGIGAMLKTQAV